MPVTDNGKAAQKAGNAQAAQQAAHINQLESMYSQAQLQTMLGAPGQEVADGGNAARGSYNLPYPNAPHDGGAQDLANQHAITQQLQGYNAQQSALVSAPTGLEKIGMTAALALSSAGLAAELAPVGASLAVGAGATAGGTVAGAAGGALAGAATGTLNAALTGNNIGKGALLGGVGGGLAGGAASYTNGLGQTISANTGLPVNASNAVASGLVRTGTGALTGALGGQLSGQGALQGAEAGASHGALNSASGAITGSIFNAGSSIFNSGDAAVPTTNTQLTDPSMSTGGYNTYDDGGIDPFGTGSTPDYLSGISPITTNSDPLAGQEGGIGYTGTGDITNPGYDNLNVQGGGSTLGGGYSSGSSGSNSLLSSLARLLTGGGSSGNGSSSGGLAAILGGSNGGNGLLAQLLGAGVNGAAGLVNQKAAQGAAQTYANQTAYNPYAVNTSGGSASYGPNGVTTSLSPGSQQTYNGLQGLAQSATNSLQAGPQAAQQQYYNQLQASQQDANNKFFQNNLDSQFANGVLGSTAGQYQSQAALNNISQQGLNDQVAASNYANTQQQNQLSQLTAGLNGVNSINSNQNTLAALGGNLGTQASDVNLQAYKPLAGANANSPLGGILSSIGNQYQNGQTTG